MIKWNKQANVHRQNTKWVCRSQKIYPPPTQIAQLYRSTRILLKMKKQTKNPFPSTWIQKQIYKLEIQQKNDIPWQNKQIQQIRPLQTNVRWEYSVLLPSRRTASIPESSFDVEEWRQEKRAIKFFHKITDRSRTYMMHSKKKKKLTKNNNKKPWKTMKKKRKSNWLITNMVQNWVKAWKDLCY